MARFTTAQGNGIADVIACPSCGNTDLFYHGHGVLTCNKDGNTFESPFEPVPLLEQVVTTYNVARTD